MASAERIIFCLCLFMSITLAKVIAQEDNGSWRQQRLRKAKDYYLAGEQFLRQGNYTAADEEFKKAQEILGGVSSLPKEDTGSPKEAGSKAIALEPKNANLHYNLAVEYLKTKQFKAAEQALKKVIQLNPKDKDAYYNLGVLYEIYLEDKRQALDYYCRYLKLAPQAEDAGKVKA